MNYQLQEIDLGIEGLYITTDNAGGASISQHLTDNEPTGCDAYEGAFDGIQSLILAHHCAGIDVTTDAYKEGLRTAFEAIANNLL